MVFRVLLAVVALLAVLVVSLVLTVAHWRTRARPLRRLVAVSAFVAGLLIAWAMALLALPAGTLQAGVEAFSARMLCLPALLLLIYCYLGWRLLRPDA